MPRAVTQGGRTRATHTRAFHGKAQADRKPGFEIIFPALARLRRIAEQRDNPFAEMMETVTVAWLGQVSGALYEVGGVRRLPIAGEGADGSPVTASG